MDSPRKRIAIVVSPMCMEVLLTKLYTITKDIDIALPEQLSKEEALQKYHLPTIISTWKLQDVVVDIPSSPDIFFKRKIISHNPRQERRMLNKYKR